MYEIAVAFLESCGYERYEVSNFAKRNSSSRSQHNQAYWNGSQYIGIGPGAHSRFFPVGEEHREARIQVLDPKLWTNAVEKHGHATHKRQKQSQQEILTELVSTGMRTMKGLDEERYYAKPNLPTIVGSDFKFSFGFRWSLFEPKLTLRDLFEDAASLQPLFGNGFIEWDSRNLRATKKGLNVVDSIIPRLLSEVYSKHST